MEGNGGAAHSCYHVIAGQTSVFLKSTCHVVLRRCTEVGNVRIDLCGQIDDLKVVFDVDIALDEVFVKERAELSDPDELLDAILDEVFDDDVAGSFVDEIEGFLVDILLVEGGAASPSTHLHSLVNASAEYFTNGEVVLGLAQSQYCSKR